MAPTASDVQNLPATQADSVEHLLRAFDRAWRSGQRPAIEKYLPPEPEQRRTALTELVHIEIEYRLQAGEPVQLSEYRRRFPELPCEMAAEDMLASDEKVPHRHCADVATMLGLSRSTSTGAGKPQLPGAQPSPGQCLGRFELLELLGTGAFGAVYRAYDRQLDRMVAVKVPRHGNLMTPEDKDRFLREARHASQLKHPGIVPVHDVGQQGDTVFLVSDYIAGTTLAERLRSCQPEAQQAAALLAQVADALHHAHQQGIIHRDVKPANILLGPDDRPYVMDFGLAKRETAETMLTQEGELLGTPAYMSPEQARGDACRVDVRSDIYSLGVVLYELLTGLLPFRGTARMVLLQILEEDPVPPRRLNEQVPHDLGTICLKCLDKEPARRYASAAALAEDLRHYLAGEPIQARPIRALGRTIKWARRRPAVAALLGLSLLLLMGLFIGGTVFTLKLQQKSAFATQQQRLAETERDHARRQGALARRRLYAAQLNLALREWHNGNTESTLALLETQRPEPGTEDLRSFEWYYLWKLCHQDVVLRGHTGDVRAVTFSADGSRLVSASDDRTIRIWDRATERQVAVLKGHDGPVSCLALSPDGRWLASGSDDRTIKLWDWQAQRLARTFQGHTNKVTALAFAPNGQWLASVSLDGTACVWDLASGKPRARYEPRAKRPSPLQRMLLAVAFTPDSRFIVTASQAGEVSVWDIRTGQARTRSRVHDDALTCLAIALDGRLLVTGGDDQRIKLWDLATLEPRGILEGHARGLTGLAFSRAGLLASTSLDATVKLWDMKTKKTIATLRGHTGAVLAPAFGPEGHVLATAGADDTIRLWDTQTGQALRKGLSPTRSDAPRDRVTWQAWQGPILALAFTGDGASLAAAGRDRFAWSREAEGIIRVWDPQTTMLRTTYHEPGCFFAFAPDPHGKFLALGRSFRQQLAQVLFWDPADGSCRKSLGETCTIYSMAVAPDGRTVATAGGIPSEQGEVVLWDVATGQARSRQTIQGDYARAVAWAPDGKTLVVALGDGRFELWDGELHSIRQTIAGHEQRIFCLAFSPDGTLLATASRDGTAKLWDAATGKLLTVLRGHTHSVTSVAFSPDGKSVATASSGGTVKLWDPVTGQERLTLPAQAGSIWAVAFSSDNSTLAAGTDQGRVVLWLADRPP